LMNFFSRLMWLRSERTTASEGCRKPCTRQG